jgi:hypothetical protein
MNEATEGSKRSVPLSRTAQWPIPGAGHHLLPITNVEEPEKVIELSFGAAHRESQILSTGDKLLL